MRNKTLFIAIAFILTVNVGIYLLLVARMIPQTSTPTETAIMPDDNINNNQHWTKTAFTRDKEPAYCATIDVVYTWVNGSDPALAKQECEVKKQLGMQPSAASEQSLT